MGTAPSMYAAESKPSNPGGISPGARVFSSPACPCASQSMVAKGSRDTSATSPSCSADPAVSAKSTMATTYCHADVLGLGPALSEGTMRKLTRGPRLLVPRGSLASYEPDGEPPSSSERKPPGSSSMNGVYFPAKMRSTLSCTFSHTSVRSARKLPLMSTPSPEISGPSSSTPVTQKVLYPKTSSLSRCTSSGGTGGSSVISRISNSESNLARISSLLRSSLPFLARSAKSASTLSSLAFSASVRSPRSLLAESDSPSTTELSHASLSLGLPSAPISGDLEDLPSPGGGAPPSRRALSASRSASSAAGEMLTEMSTDPSGGSFFFAASCAARASSAASCACRLVSASSGGSRASSADMVDW
mmetsp:Transcript_33283/g.53289  ORF Transcript_33283/g.53289 Transcript_33283/m.53289 type:complete len:361 (+) Transcript_33283:4339-5421(+)